MYTRLEKAIEFALKVHSGREDKGGCLDILHALRIMLKVTDKLKIPAVLHDVVEDGAKLITFKVLEDTKTILFYENDIFWLSLEEAWTLQTLSRENEETYVNYILRVRKTIEAMVIKIVDLEDHLHLDRLANIPPSLIQRYLEALRVLNE